MIIKHLMTVNREGTCYNNLVTDRMDRAFHDISYSNGKHITLPLLFP